MPPVETVLAENEKLKAELSKKDSGITLKDERIAELEAQIAWFRRRVFAGGKSEKVDIGQLDFLLGKLEEEKAVETEKVSYERKAKSPRRSREELYGNLPVLEETVIEPDEVKADPESYERSGQEETFEVKVQPPRFYRRRIIRPKYRKIKDRSLPPVVAPAPQSIVEGIASVELLVYIIIAKYLDHLPLFRQCAIYKCLLPARCFSLRCRHCVPRYMGLLCPLLTSRLHTRRLPDEMRGLDGRFKPTTRESETSPDKSTNFHRANVPSTLRPKPEGFAAWCPLAPDDKPCMAFLYIAPRLCLRLPPDPISRLRPCPWLILL